MTCRHMPGDPNCSSYPQYLEKQRLAELVERTPTPDNYEVVDVRIQGKHLVMRVKYSSCPKCSYDSQKIMVFLNCTVLDALKWNRIDPHFDDKPRSEHEAPSPAARFPACDEGWADAIQYAYNKDNHDYWTKKHMSKQ